MEHRINRTTRKRFTIDGLAPERWFLKTFINIAYKQYYPLGAKSAQPWEPPCNLVEVAFGRQEFEPRAGLYFLGDPGEQIDSNERHRIVTFVNAMDQLVGAMFYFRGFRFLLYVDKSGPGEQVHLALPGISGPSRPLYHLANIRVKLGNHLSHVIEIRWVKKDDN